MSLNLILSPPPQFQIFGATSVIVSLLFMLFYLIAPLCTNSKNCFLEKLKWSPLSVIFPGPLLGATTTLLEELFCEIRLMHKHDALLISLENKYTYGPKLENIPYHSVERDALCL